jgi:uncharacterized coiled-coil protein SlyX
MDLFGKDNKEEQRRLGETIKNLSDRIGALQLELNSRNKQVEELTNQLVAEQQKNLSATSVQQSQQDSIAATEMVLKDTQQKVRDLEKMIGELATAAREAEAKAATAQAEAEQARQTASVFSGGLQVGMTAYVQKAGGKNLRLRSAPGLNSEVLGSLAPGTQLSLLAGPTTDDGYQWWQIRAADGREGWVAGSELVTAPE